MVPGPFLDMRWTSQSINNQYKLLCIWEITHIPLLVKTSLVFVMIWSVNKTKLLILVNSQTPNVQWFLKIKRSEVFKT